MLGAAVGVDVAAVEAELTRLHAAADRASFARAIPSVAIDLVGFHGHTILHRPAERRTWQIGDGALLARLAGIDVVADFRSADVAAGGEGAPLAPLYHAALAADLAKPVAILNLGGVGNVTWIGPGALTTILAFDTGPGNALIDDWVRTPYRRRRPISTARWRAPDRLRPRMSRAFWRIPISTRASAEIARPRRFPGARSRDGLSLADGAATLTEMTAAAVAAAIRHFRAPPREWLVCGGGRHNPAIMAALARHLGGRRCGRSRRSAADGDALGSAGLRLSGGALGRGLPLSLPRQPVRRTRCAAAGCSRPPPDPPLFDDDFARACADAPRRGSRRSRACRRRW